MKLPLNFTFSLQSDEYEYNEEFQKDADSLDHNNSENMSKSSKRLHLKCLACDPPLCDNLHFCDNALRCYLSISRDSMGLIRKSRGCLVKEDSVHLQCSTKRHVKQNKVAHNNSNPDYESFAAYHLDCCYERNNCNDGDFPILPMYINRPNHFSGEDDFEANTFDATQQNSPALSYIIIAGIILLFLLFGGTFWGISWIKATHKKRMNQFKPRAGVEGENFIQLSDEQHQLQTKALGDSTLKEFMDGTMSSGSGSGLPLLSIRTLAKNIQLVECIGKGKYGEVWRGVWNCENVAVKIFSTRDEASWIRETEIYSTVMLRHNNILGFYGSDMTSSGGSTQLWLVTHYHRHGSLYDFLNKRSISQVQLLKMAYSIANGLAYLHSEMVGTESRPGISHRDIKSKNILVTSHEACVIADFGLAVTHKRDTGELNVFPNPKVGTKRYMAPELLDESMNVKSFDGYKRVDIYALGLVFWEMCRRTNSQGSEDLCEDYNPPYFDVVTSDPSFDEMRKVVCIDEYRPEIPNRWISEQVLSAMSRIIHECWHPNPSVRLSSLRVKKSIATIAQELYEGELETVNVNQIFD